ncbi:MAG: Rieske 2Fe-2S domain-containing protein [Planctomycetota bacterium]
MGHTYRAVQWNAQKKRYDLAIAAGVVLYLAAFFGVSAIVHPAATAETVLLRALGTSSFVLLHVILSIGPLARRDPRWLPLLYNRRHLGVTMATLATLHGAIATFQFHALGDENPLVSLFTANTRYDSVAQFPFQTLGFFALVILVLMAATSHDFWLRNLSAPVWKSLHMLVYVAYALLALHVALGSLQAETTPVPLIALAAGVLWLGWLHLGAARRESAIDRGAESGAWVDAGPVDEIPEGRAKVVVAGGDRIAVFRSNGRLSALSSVCQHQNGPLGEGRIVDGLVVCPWHGYQYRPRCGSSPEPFDERVPTFRVKVEGGHAFVDPNPLPLGTETEPVAIDA